MREPKAVTRKTPRSQTDVPESVLGEDVRAGTATKTLTANTRRHPFLLANVLYAEIVSREK